MFYWLYTPLITNHKLQERWGVSQEHCCSLQPCVVVMSLTENHILKFRVCLQFSEETTSSLSWDGSLCKFEHYISWRLHNMEAGLKWKAICFVSDMVWGGCPALFIPSLLQLWLSETTETPLESRQEEILSLVVLPLYLDCRTQIHTVWQSP